MKRFISITLVLAFSLLFAAVCEARTKREMTYRYSQIWRTAIRFLRVDNRFPIVEKDRKSGYVLFEFKDGGKTYSGSLELYPVVHDGKHYMRTGLIIGGKPSYVEAVLLDKLKRKLREEYGEPPPARLVKAESTSQGDGKGENSKSGSSATGDTPPEDEEDIEVKEKDLDKNQKE